MLSKRKSKLLDEIVRIAQDEFGDIVASATFVYRRAGLAEKVRLLLCDDTIADIWINPSGTRYSFHWEQRAKRGLIYRYDNAPDFPQLSTFPKHFHNGSETQIEPSNLSDNPEMAVREFLSFIRKKLNKFEA